MAVVAGEGDGASVTPDESFMVGYMIGMIAGFLVAVIGLKLR